MDYKTIKDGMRFAFRSSESGAVYAGVVDGKFLGSKPERVAWVNLKLDYCPDKPINQFNGSLVTLRVRDLLTA